VEARRSKSQGPQLWMNNGLPSGQQTKSYWKWP
jgi:hypothetical protein